MAWLTKETNPGWIVIAGIFILVLSTILVRGITLSFETIVWGVAIVIMVVVILIMMKESEIVIAPVEAKDQSRAQKQRYAILLIGGLVIAAAIFLVKMGILHE